jgi:hypothetical protein
MGSGKNGTFDKIPDLKQWGIMGVFTDGFFGDYKNLSTPAFLQKAYGSFIGKWISLFSGKTETYLLEPIEGHGLWNGRQVFGDLPKNSEYGGEIAIMTRATIRFSKLGRFWQHVPDAASEMATADGFLNSYGLGEWPWIKQATFSIWRDKESMRNFAYKSRYSEEMFTRFKVLYKF